MKKLLVLFLVLISVAYADYGVKESYVSGTPFTIAKHVYNTTSGEDITGATCNLTVLTSAMAVSINAATMTDSGNGWYNYSVSGLSAGDYFCSVKCSKSVYGASTTCNFNVVASDLAKQADMVEIGADVNTTIANQNTEYLATQGVNDTVRDILSDTNLFDTDIERKTSLFGGNYYGATQENVTAVDLTESDFLTIARYTANQSIDCILYQASSIGCTLWSVETYQR